VDFYLNTNSENSIKTCSWTCYDALTMHICMEVVIGEYLWSYTQSKCNLAYWTIRHVYLPCTLDSHNTAAVTLR